MRLDQDLEQRINPEKNRQFAPEEFGKRLIELRKFAASHWPQKNGLRISVVGTNGKGSVSHYLASLLQKSGIQTGVYSSPHLNHFSERIQIAGQSNVGDLEDAYLELRRAFRERNESLWKDLSYFELLTLLAIELFQHKGLPVQIYEAGLGGRLDATGLCNPDVVIVTRIALDHMKLLGNTRGAIFQEKLGIMTTNTRHVYLMEARYESLAKTMVEQLWQNTGTTDGSNAPDGSSAPADIAPIHVHSIQVHSFESGPRSDATTDPNKDEKGLEISPPRDTEKWQKRAHSSYLAENFSFAKWILSDLIQQSKNGEDSIALLETGNTRHIEMSDVSAPPGRMLDHNAHGILWMYDSGHNPASLFTVLRSFPSPPILVLGILPDRSYLHFLRVARWLGVERVYCIERVGLASVPEQAMDAISYISPGNQKSEYSKEQLTTQAEPRGKPEAIGSDPLLFRLDSALPPEELRRILIDGVRSRESLKKSQMDPGPGGPGIQPAILFTGSYRIYDLFLEILGGDIVHA
ncbi:MAG: hypothetical protein CMF59_10865 [Leptospiraceae bacterium]|nr:hypothetical protein [Leptospiraceae bacterium]